VNFSVGLSVLITVGDPVGFSVCACDGNSVGASVDDPLE